MWATFICWESGLDYVLFIINFEVLRNVLITGFQSLFPSRIIFICCTPKLVGQIAYVGLVLHLQVIAWSMAEPQKETPNAVLVSSKHYFFISFKAYLYAIALLTFPYTFIDHIFTLLLTPFLSYKFYYQ